jgi:hypothetical protein
VTAAPRPPCRHCCTFPVTRPRGLCWRCYRQPESRNLYPPQVNHLPRRPFPPCKVCGRGVACQPSDYVKNFYGVCSTCKREEPLRSQYHARIDAHQRRIQAELVRMGDAA